MGLIGIDLGTTNSVAAAWVDDKPVLIPNALGDFLTPSAVSLGEKGQWHVGLAARERQSTHPHLTATSFKRLMGTDSTLKLGKKSFSAEDLSAMVLSSLKEDASRFLGEPVEGAVITVPAYFNDRQRKATQRAAQMAGLKVERLINEPTAAALAFGIHNLDQNEPFLVFDLGGGTFDVSIVEMFENVIEVRSSSGDPRLGGIDFNEALANLAVRKIGGDLPVVLQDAQAGHILREAAERTRRKLSEQDEAPFSFLWKEEKFETTISSGEFEEATSDLQQRLRDPIQRALRDTGLRVDELSELVMVGGATRMPIIRKTVTRLFGRFPNQSQHPDHAVALGAAIQAGLKARHAALEEIRMTDVCPFTLGVDVMEIDQFGAQRDGIFSPIIERNRTIPTSVVKTFSTASDNQTKVEFGIYQGEAREVSANVKLGKVSASVPAAPAGQIAIECRFSYDTSGLLEVDLSVPSTGKSWRHTFGDSDIGKAELERRRKVLEKLKVHPRDDAANAAVLARANRVYEGLLGEERDYVGHIILRFEAVLEQQQPRQIEEARGQVIEVLNEIDGEGYL